MVWEIHCKSVLRYVRQKAFREREVLQDSAHRGAPAIIDYFAWRISEEACNSMLDNDLLAFMLPG